MNPRIDLNCDLGEGAGQDELLMPLITSANIACGGHAGDESIMTRTVRNAIKQGVAIGAHPGYEDREHFGRRELMLSAGEISGLVKRQITVLQRITAAEGGVLAHVKPHGALYNQAARDPVIADAIARAVAGCCENTLLYALAGSELVAAGQRLGLDVAQEVFADRLYQSDGSLVPRSRPGALVEGEDLMIQQALDMVMRGRVRTVTGCEITVCADTLCLHGDGQHAVRFAHALRRALLAAGVTVASLARR